MKRINKAMMIINNIHKIMLTSALLIVGRCGAADMTASGQMNTITAQEARTQVVKLKDALAKMQSLRDETMKKVESMDTKYNVKADEEKLSVLRNLIKEHGGQDWVKMFNDVIARPREEGLKQDLKSAYTTIKYCLRDHIANMEKQIAMLQQVIQLLEENDSLKNKLKLLNWD